MIVKLLLEALFFLLTTLVVCVFSGETVERNLQKYLKQAEMLLRAGNVDLQEHYIELCLMVIQCLEVLIFIIVYPVE